MGKKRNWIKRNAPIILTTTAAVVATAFAVCYRNERIKVETVDTIDHWHTIKVPPGIMQDILTGAVLKYRLKEIGPNNYYTQATTLDDFSDEANAAYAEID